MWEVERLDATLLIDIWYYQYIYMYIYHPFFEIPVDTGEPCDSVEDINDVVCGTEVKVAQNI